jgi:hypothetical protein
MANIGVYRAVGSPAPDAGLYQHSACTHTEIFAKGNILALCSNRSCPNKGANWVLQDITATIGYLTQAVGRPSLTQRLGPKHLPTQFH